MLGEVDDAHAPASEHTLDAIPRERRADERLRRHESF
jgi:hypothetical protein